MIEHHTQHSAGRPRHGAQTGILLRIRARLARFGRRDDGATAVEFAMIISPFLALILAIFEVGIHYFVETTLQSGTDSVARQVRTGELRNNASGDMASEFRQALCAEGMLFLFDCGKMKFEIRQMGSFGAPGDPPRKPDGSVDDTGFQASPGGRSTVNLVRVYYEWPAFLNWTKFGVEAKEWKRNTRLMEATAMFQNEPY